MKLKFLSSEFAICQLLPDEPKPDWANQAVSGEFLTTISTKEELTIVCSQACVPNGQRSSRGWSCFRIQETLDFDVVGVIAKLSQSLADAKIPVFVISSYNTDYVLIPKSKRQSATLELEKAGYQFV